MAVLVFPLSPMPAPDPRARAAQAKVDETYRDQALWTRMSIMSTGGSAFFSSDRTIVRLPPSLSLIPALGLLGRRAAGLMHSIACHPWNRVITITHTMGNHPDCT